MLLQKLEAIPVLGVSLGNVSLLRLDQTGGLAPGNKSFKLRPYIEDANRLGVTRLVSFGGAWSNHLHALAAVGSQHSMETIGIVRGEAGREESAMILDARRWGMRIEYVSREEYRQRNDVLYQQQLTFRFGPCLLIPEGGSSVAGARGCEDIADIIRQNTPLVNRIVLPVGTGTTLAGLLAGLGGDLDNDTEVFGISALKGASDLEQRVESLLAQLESNPQAKWRILHEYHCGGFARVSASLRGFIQAFEAVHQIEVEPVYTAKILFAIHQLRECGQWHDDAPVLAIHTGGLQGRRGYPWLN